jgi:hypothetical protein
LRFEEGIATDTGEQRLPQGRLCRHRHRSGHVLEDPGRDDAGAGAHGSSTWIEGAVDASEFVHGTGSFGTGYGFAQAKGTRTGPTGCHQRLMPWPRSACGR